MDIKKALQDGIKYSRYEKIENGIYEFKIDKVELTKTQRSNRECISYLGQIKNNSGEYQESKLVDAVDNEDNIKFGISRLVRFIKYFKVATDQEINSCETMEQMIDLANRAIGRNIKIEFVKKFVNGMVIKEKQFIYE